MPKKYILICFLVILGIPLFYSLNTEITNSHYFRQCQTAQTAFIFKSEGWTPLLPKIRFMGRPGYNVLEFPWYQSLTAGLSSALGLAVETSGRILNIVFGICLALGVSLVLFQFRSLTRPDPLNNEDIEQKSWFVLIFSTPLIFAMSQWIIVDVMNVMCAVWVLYFFLKAFTGPAKILDYISLFILAAISLTLKPTALFALAPFFIFTLLNRKFRWKESLKIAVPLLLALGIAAAWFIYGDQTNRKYQAGFGLSTAKGQYFIPSVDLMGVAKFLGRVVFYLGGLGTWALVLFGVFKDHRSVKNNLFANRKILAVSAFSIFLYFVCFSNLNIHHSYYQLALILPVMAIGFFSLLPGFHIRPGWPLGLALLLNVVTGTYFLTTPDKDLVKFIAYAKENIGAGPQLDDLMIVGNLNSLAPLLSYYRDRYVVNMGTDVAKENLLLATRQNLEMLGVCDRSLNDDCIARIIESSPNCHDRAKTLGRFWLCEISSLRKSSL